MTEMDSCVACMHIKLQLTMSMNRQTYFPPHYAIGGQDASTDTSLILESGRNFQEDVLTLYKNIYTHDHNRGS